MSNSAERCILCNQRIADDTAAILDIGISARKFLSGSPVGACRRKGHCLCGSCLARVGEATDSLQEAVLAAMQERVVILPFRLPKVGESVFDIVEGIGIIESVITSYENGQYTAEAKKIKGAAPISFTPFDIGHNVFLSKKDAAEARRAGK